MDPDSRQRPPRPALLPTWSETAANLLKASLAKIGGALAPEPPAAQRVFNAQGFRLMGDRMLDDCRRQKRPLCIAVLDFTDLREAHGVYERDVVKALLDATLKRLFDMAGPRGLVAHTSSTEFTVVMPGLDLPQGRAALERCLGHPAKIEFSSQGAEILLVPDVELEAAGPDIEHVQELYEELRQNIDEAQEYYRKYAEHIAQQRERERAYMAKPPAPPQLKPDPLGPDDPSDAVPSIPTTWAAPLRKEEPPDAAPGSLNIDL